jgi:hypothetical protein
MMLDSEHIGFWLLLVGVGGVVGFLLLRGLFSAEAREARRRHRSHGRVVSRGKRSLIKLAAKTEDSKEERNR